MVSIPAKMKAAVATIVSQIILMVLLMIVVFMFLQLAKIVKISDKIRIFAAGYAKHIICRMQFRATALIVISSDRPDCHPEQPA